MAQQDSTQLTNSIRQAYVAQYLDRAYGLRLYEQFAKPVPSISMDEAYKASQLNYNFLSGMTRTHQTISETEDVRPQILRDATVNITGTSRMDALMWTEAADLKYYTDYGEKRFQKLGENMIETIEDLVLEAAVTGGWVERATTRDALDAGTAGHRLAYSDFGKMQGLMLSLKVPSFPGFGENSGTWGALMHPFSFHDVTNATPVVSIATYIDKTILLNFELGMIGPWRLMVHPNAKVFGAAGADNGTVVATTLSTAAKALDTTIVTAADVSANIAKGLLWTIGTEETANTLYPMNERVRIIGASTNTLTIVGEGENGGLRFDHPVGTPVRNADSVYTVTWGGPESLVKLFAPSVGEFGEVVGPKKTGILDQWATLGWKWYGGYGRLKQNSLIRSEHASAYDNV